MSKLQLEIMQLAMDSGKDFECEFDFEGSVKITELPAVEPERGKQ